jgi:hypothetical protein
MTASKRGLPRTAVQLYTLRGVPEPDLFSVIPKLAAFGYAGIELSGSEQRGTRCFKLCLRFSMTAASSRRVRTLHSANPGWMSTIWTTSKRSVSTRWWCPFSHRTLSQISMRYHGQRTGSTEPPNRSPPEV